MTKEKALEEAFKKLGQGHELDDECKKAIAYYWGFEKVTHCNECRFYCLEGEKLICQIWEVFNKQASPPPYGFCHAAIKRYECDF